MSKKRKRKRRRLNYNRVIGLCLVILFIIAGGAFVVRGINKKNNDQSKSHNNIVSAFNQDNEDVETYEASILASGDVMVHSP